MRVPASPPAVTTSWRGVRLCSARATRRDIGRLARNPEATNRSERTMRSAATTNNQSRSKKPALVSCSTSSGMLCSSLLSVTFGSRKLRALGDFWVGRVVVNLFVAIHMLPLPGDRSALGPEDETGLPHPYHIAVDELPTLYRGAVDGSAVGGPEIGESGRPSVPGDLQMPS